MTNIFIDIGAHIGESIEVAIHPKYNFAKIYAFEPSAHCKKYLNKYRDSRLSIQNFALGNSDRYQVLFGSGSVGASIYEEKTAYWSQNEEIEFKKFSVWWNDHIKKQDKVWLKINAEGGELEIIEELQLIKSGHIISALISFDIDKINSLKSKHNYLVSILKELRINFIDRNETNLSVNEWLKAFPEISSVFSLSRLLKGILRPDIPISRNLRRILKPLFPKKFWLGFALKFGPNRKR
ncbi:MAG: Methyltransferase FkbM domain [Actinomycetota bacterium]|jgi:FkbM family methyltransferase